ncbi:MAG: hypothetical protein LUE22_01550 [Oscillospiraceae bacterium]|nr:hypothetical protein [Oscillospiraceae bacterium]
MNVISAKLEGNALTLGLDTASRQEAARWVYKFKPGGWDLIRGRKKRSLDANAYCWSLCQQIGAELGISKDEVYRSALSDGNAFTQIFMMDDALADFEQKWCSNGLGWFVKLSSRSNGGTWVHAYYGSHVFDTREMSALIDRLIEDARALGIDTLTEREKSLLLEDWGCE